ncbi:hypothetical protein BDY19DRAFT_972394 [Irpex rosettiformis]|uniref:Uncharacterized protein n=1 Tax=Irpex rosettiformis TaxID=378272 RepID=A0ACB8TQT2_9APHY|nr:hypothetical protein BDY19DRAFT_972394 [Irpex rosettiformis]
MSPVLEMQPVTKLVSSLFKPIHFRLTTYLYSPFQGTPHPLPLESAQEMLLYIPTSSIANQIGFPFVRNSRPSSLHSSILRELFGASHDTYSHHVPYDISITTNQKFVAPFKLFCDISSNRFPWIAQNRRWPFSVTRCTHATKLALIVVGSRKYSV